MSVPVAGADIVLRPSAKRTRTDSAGRFTFSGLDPNTYTVVARKVGYFPETWDVKLTKSSRMDITMVLGRQLPTLDTVVTRASRDCPLFSYEAFLCRRGWKGGVFLDDEAITDQDVIYVGELFRSMSDFRVDFHLEPGGVVYTLRPWR
ncbi:MAG: carboxypeptidase-like regulatory domain-containing protein, partial [bacterium]